MPMPLTPKQEKFCLSYIETGNASEAYRLAYNAGKMKAGSIHRKAKELLDNGKITARINELRAAHRERHNVTVDSITTELEEARQQAIKAGSPSAAVAASMGKAKLHGLLVEKTEISGKDGQPIAVASVDREAYRRAREEILTEY